MGKINVEKEIMEIVRNKFKIRRVNPDEDWEKLDVDSLGLVEFIVHVKEHFKISIKPEDLSKVRTLRQFIELVSKKANK